MTVCKCLDAPMMASNGQALMHSVQPMHSSSMIRAIYLPVGIILWLLFTLRELWFVNEQADIRQMISRKWITAWTQEVEQRVKQLSGV